MTMIKCTSLYGKKKLISEDKLVFSPAVYAVIVNDGKILLLNTRHTGKYFFPGGGIDLGEKVEEALKREVKEETGTEIEIEKFLHFKESFFYYNPLKEAYHSFSFFFVCKPKTFDLIDDDDDGESEKPRWIDIKILKENDFQSFGGEVFQLYKNLF